MMTDAERYTQFFIATLPFCDSAAEIRQMWDDQLQNRMSLGISRAQNREMIDACVARKEEVERLASRPSAEIIPMRRRR